MTSAELLFHVTTAALAMLTLALLLSLVRLLRGPTLPDRILALDLMTTLGTGLIAVLAIRTGFTLYVDMALGLGLVGFLSTVALARYLLQRPREVRRES